MPHTPTQVDKNQAWSSERILCVSLCKSATQASDFVFYFVSIFAIMVTVFQKRDDSRASSDVKVNLTSAQKCMDWQ